MAMSMQKAMIASISEVLETMFFMATEIKDVKQTDRPYGITTGKNIGSVLEFSGSVSGKIFVIAPEALVSVMTTSFTGQDLEISREHLEGIINELVNMIAGNTFSHMDNNSQFILGIPEVLTTDDIASLLANETPDEILTIKTLDGQLTCGAIIA